MTDEAVIYTYIVEKAILEDVYVSAVFLKYEQSILKWEIACFFERGQHNG